MAKYSAKIWLILGQYFGRWVSLYRKGASFRLVDHTSIDSFIINISYE